MASQRIDTMVDWKGRERPVRWGHGALRKSRRFVPQSVYVDPARYAAEVEMMRASWLIGCMELEIPEHEDTALFEGL